MTRWCPVCESPGVPVAQGTGPLDGQKLLAVSRDLPGIEPNHVCSQCPTFFRGRDRFYLTALDGRGIHGISVWPHRERPLLIEVGDEGMVATDHRLAPRSAHHLRRADLVGLSPRRRP